MSLWKLQPDGLEEIRMYPVHYLRILTRIICLRQGNKLLMSEEKPQKAESAVVVFQVDQFRHCNAGTVGPWRVRMVSLCIGERSNAEECSGSW